MVETRIVKQIKIYELALNDMRDPKIEYTCIAAISTDYDKLVAWYNEQKAAEHWIDGRWEKFFKKGSPLEWYNPSCLKLNQDIKSEWILASKYIDIKNSGIIPVIE